jgi:hypothetical protein
MSLRFAAALQEQAVDSALRDLVLAWRHRDRLLMADAPLMERLAADGLVDDLIERLSLVLPQLPPHEPPPSEDNPCPPARFALEMLEGGAWAVLYHGGRQIIRPNPAEKVWETDVITGYRDVWNDEIGMTFSQPIHERQTFKTLNGALAFSCAWLRTRKAGT